MALFQDRRNSVFPTDRHDVNSPRHRTKSPHGTSRNADADSCDLILVFAGRLDFLDL
tara:strand:- start:720 stop:890 length:171 start_codon:yes stop_codon:yes gene_type:complete